MHLRGEHTVNTDEDRVQLIADLTEEGSQSPMVRTLAENILKSSGVREKDQKGEMREIFNWVKQNIRYTGDISGRDTYFTADRIIQNKCADCDDFAIITGSLLASVGFPVGCRIITMDKNIGFHHIYTIAGLRSGMAYLGGDMSGVRWVALDGTNKHYRAGQEPNWRTNGDHRDFQFIFGDD